jgi:hypothetical protein
MVQKRLFLNILMIGFSLLAMAEDHMSFVNIPLSLSPADLSAQLVAKGLRQQDSCTLSGRIAGLDVWLRIGANKDTTGCSHLMLSTNSQQGLNLNDDYTALMKWMQRHYGKPTWESTVRNHRFARWFVGYDRDIVMIATARQTVELWFYDNHQVRNVDYYAILKYCERYPSDDVPYYTAQDLVTWKSTAPPEVSKKKLSKRHKRERHRSKRAAKRRRRR